jgi:serine/threonine protein phosphatase PrpC
VTALACPSAVPATEYFSVARSHVGRVRAINEDRVLDYPTAGLWAVADGMGGHAGGDVAAQAVVDRLRSLGACGYPLGLPDVLAALAQANADICHRNDLQNTVAGATVVVALLEGDVASIAWAGDSRAYRLRGGKLELLTRDHSVVQELIDAGLLSPGQAEHHPHANVVTKALGVANALECQTLRVQNNAGDGLLLCSDGLSRCFTPGDEWPGSIADAAACMLETALRRDGSDNVSLVLISASENALAGSACPNRPNSLRSLLHRFSPISFGA